MTASTTVTTSSSSASPRLDCTCITCRPPARPVLGPTPPPATRCSSPTWAGFVRPKGVLDVLDVCDRLADRGLDDFRLNVVGPPLFSEPAVLAEVQARAASRPHLRFHGELDDDVLAGLMSQVDVLVVPSYHEGYCVPVVEAYAAGCQVVAYDSTNLPNVVGDVGQLVPTGDVDALTDVWWRRPPRPPGAAGARTRPSRPAVVARH